jgi:cytochrome c peroxidase
VSQFWDGRAKNVEEQAGMPVLNPVEMNMPSESYVEQRFSSIKGYQSLFADAYPKDKKAITYLNIKRAIAAFERTLITPTRFDKFLTGDINALKPEEKKGLRVFIETGCATCHNGVAKGGAMLQKFPVYGESYVQAIGSTHDDLGKMESSKDEMDKHLFKVPSLINITKTAPYFHDGSVARLEDAIRIMAKLQLNKELNSIEISQVKLFLNSLEGEVPSTAFIVPNMPK